MSQHGLERKGGKAGLPGFVTESRAKARHETALMCLAQRFSEKLRISLPTWQDEEVCFPSFESSCSYDEKPIKLAHPHSSHTRRRPTHRAGHEGQASLPNLQHGGESREGRDLTNSLAGW